MVKLRVIILLVRALSNYHSERWQERWFIPRLHFSRPSYRDSLVLRLCLLAPQLGEGQSLYLD